MQTHLSLFFESICQVAVSIREVWLKLNGPFVSIYSQLYKPEKRTTDG